MSTPIKTPSRTVLADGQIIFIIYRRDVASSGPERVTVRVIAKIINVEDAWTIRNVSYELKVAPLSEGLDVADSASEFRFCISGREISRSQRPSP
jgi:hypothetical protein